jgi:hypothetical protein
LIFLFAMEDKTFYGKPIEERQSEGRGRSEERKDEILNKRIERELRTNRGLTDRTKSEIINRELNDWVSSIVSQKAAQNVSSNNAVQSDKPSEVEIIDLGGSAVSPLSLKTSLQESGGGSNGGGGGGGGGGATIPNGVNAGDILYWSGSAWVVLSAPTGSSISIKQFDICENGEPKQVNMLVWE